MPDQLQDLLLKRQSAAPNVQLPTEGQDTWLDTLMHRAGVATGLSEQKGGDLGDAIAAVSGMLPIGRIIGAARAAKTAEAAEQAAKEARGVFATPAMAAEFGPINAAERPALSLEEAKKAADLTAPPAKPTATFAHYQDDFDGGAFPQYNIEGGPYDKSTVGVDRLKELGIDIPHTPARSASPDDQAFASALAKIQALKAGNREGYRQVPFDVVDANHPAIKAGADYNRPSLADVDINKLVATQPTVTEDVVKQYLQQARNRADQLPVGVYGAPRKTDLPIVMQGSDGRYYIGDGTHRIVADWAKGNPTVQVIQYPSKLATDDVAVPASTILNGLRNLEKK